MTFSDSESTGTEGSGNDETPPEIQATDSGHDETWLLSLMQPLDTWMRLSTPSLYRKWRAFSNLTLMYHRATRDLRADLEGDELQLHLLREMCARVEAEKQRLEARVVETEAELARSQAVVNKVKAMVFDEMHLWEMVDSVSDSGDEDENEGKGTCPDEEEVKL